MPSQSPHQFVFGHLSRVENAAVATPMLSHIPPHLTDVYQYLFSNPLSKYPIQTPRVVAEMNPVSAFIHLHCRVGVSSPPFYNFHRYLHLQFRLQRIFLIWLIHQAFHDSHFSTTLSPIIITPIPTKATTLLKTKPAPTTTSSLLLSLTIKSNTPYLCLSAVVIHNALSRSPLSLSFNLAFVFFFLTNSSDEFIFVLYSPPL